MRSGGGSARTRRAGDAPGQTRRKNGDERGGGGQDKGFMGQGGGKEGGMRASMGGGGGALKRMHKLRRAVPPISPGARAITR